MTFSISRILNLLEVLLETTIDFLKSKRDKKINSYPKMQSGIAKMSQTHGWNNGNPGYMANTTGTRESHSKVNFESPFEKTPQIHYA